MKAIVVDDDEVVLQGLNMVIPWGDLGYDRVISAKNGEEAYRKAVCENPDVIITDIRMPVMDGLELSRRVHETMDYVAIIIMSAYEDFQYAKSAIQYGVADYILKPIDLDKIRQLNQRLTRIREKKYARGNMLRSLYSGELEARITADLKNADLGDIELFLNGEIRRLVPSASDRKELCLKMADALFTYYESMGVCLNKICKSKEEVIADISETNSYEESRIKILKLFHDVFEFLSTEKAKHEDVLASAARHIVDQEFSSSSLSLQYVADRIGVTPCRLSVLFREAFGINFSSYLARLRIEKSQNLLRDLSLKIEDIGGMVGYSDSHYFAKVFKRSVNLTPSEYRNISGGHPYVT